MSTMLVDLRVDGIAFLLLRISVGATVAGVVLLFGKIIYNIYFHPLAQYPGPKTWSALQLRWVLSVLSGRLVYETKDLHAKYGDVVRLGPDHISFSSAGALRDIYMRQSTRPAMPKDRNTYAVPPGEVHSILTIKSDEDHARYRRLLAHAFSDKSLQEQAPIIEQYVALLIKRLKESPEAHDMVKWFNFVSFDIIGDLTLGESFHSLDEAKYHPWVSYLLLYFKSSAYFSTARTYPFLTPLLLPFIPKALMQGRGQHKEFAQNRIEARMASMTNRSDFMSNVLKHNEKETGMSKEEIIATFTLLIVAGSETTATALSVATFFLATHPGIMRQLADEIRTTFTTEDEITQVSTNKCKYLLAVLEEGLRVHPSTPRGPYREVPRGGEYIDGHWMPEDTLVNVSPYITGHLHTKFTDPNDFIPERWLGNERYQDDDRAAFMPFSLGPRNCIGRNLAYAEMRLILARLVWNFDFEIDARSRGWVDHMKMYILWEKPPLWVKLKPVQR